MKKFSVIITSLLCTIACSKAPDKSQLADSRPYPGAFDAGAALFNAGNIPEWRELAVTHFSVGTTAFSSSKDTATDVSGFFYLDPSSNNVFFDLVFYTGIVVNWQLQDYINKVTPVIRAGNLLPLQPSSDGRAYAGGYRNMVQAFFRTAVDSQNNRWLVQSRMCIAASGCNLPDGQGRTQRFAQNEVFAYSMFQLNPAPLTFSSLR